MNFKLIVGVAYAVSLLSTASYADNEDYNNNNGDNYFANSTLSISPVVSGFCLDIAGNNAYEGAGLAQYRCHNGPNQRFFARDMGDGSVSLEAQNSGLCLDVPQSTYNDTQIRQYRCNGNDNQRFYFQNVGGNDFQITLKHSGKCVDVYNPDGQADRREGTAILQAGCHGGANQVFRVNQLGGYPSYPQNPPYPSYPPNYPPNYPAPYPNYPSYPQPSYPQPQYPQPSYPQPQYPPYNPPYNPPVVVVPGGGPHGGGGYPGNGGGFPGNGNPHQFPPVVVVPGGGPHH